MAFSDFFILLCSIGNFQKPLFLIASGSELFKHSIFCFSFSFDQQLVATVNANRPTPEDKLEQKLHKALQSAEIRREVDFNSVINLHEFNCRMQAENHVIQAHFPNAETDAFKEDIRKYFADNVARLTDKYKAEVSAYASATDKNELPRKAAKETLALCAIMEGMAQKKIESKKNTKRSATKN